MRHIHVVVLGLGLLMTPFGALAQSAAPVAAPAAAETNWSTATMLAVGAGAVVGVVALNAVTGGAMLAPMAGPAISNALGGSVLGPAAMSVAARQALCRTTTLLTAAAVGAGLGYWIVSE